MVKRMRISKYEGCGNSFLVVKFESDINYKFIEYDLKNCDNLFLKTLCLPINYVEKSIKDDFDTEMRSE